MYSQENCNNQFLNSLENYLFGVCQSNASSQKQQPCQNEMKNSQDNKESQPQRENNECQAQNQKVNCAENSKLTIHTSPIISCNEHEETTQQCPNPQNSPIKNNLQKLEQGQLIQQSQTTQKTQKTDLTKITRELDILGVKQTGESQILDIDIESQKQQSLPNKIYVSHEQQVLINLTIIKIQKIIHFSCCRFYWLFFTLIDIAFKVLFLGIAFQLIEQQDFSPVPNTENFDLILACAVFSGLSSISQLIYQFLIIFQTKKRNTLKPYCIVGLQGSLLFQVVSYALIFYCQWGEFQVLQIFSIFLFLQSLISQSYYINFFQDLYLRISYCLHPLKFDPFQQKFLLNNESN